jgi:hypothetical protein
MSESTRDVSSQSDLKKLELEADGSFNRAPSTFRDTIQEGSRYEPEKGILNPAQHQLTMTDLYCELRSLPSLCFIRLSLGKPYPHLSEAQKTGGHCHRLYRLPANGLEWVAVCLC